MLLERWNEIKDKLLEALRLEPSQRAVYLAQTGATDPELRSELESLIAFHERTGTDFLNAPWPPAVSVLALQVEPDAGNTLLAAGTRLGPYEVQALLGAGGMGEVYRARDIRLNRIVAIKVIPRSLSTDAARLQRFEREARAIAALQHPNICTLHDVGHEEGIQFLVMEHLDGETLSKRLQKGRLSLEQTLRYGAEIADALDAAHHQGIVHRDLKPANIFITSHGESKVLDFGLAKLDELDPELDPLVETATDAKLVTTAGVAMGTAPYMSPEQARGENLDARTDIFSLGSVLYEMATGQMAFQGKTTALVHKSILDESPPPPSRVAPSFPEQLDHIVAKALEKDRELRYQSASGMRTDLNRLKGDSTSGGSASASDAKSGPHLADARKSGRSKNRWIVGSASALLILIPAAWWVIRHPDLFRPHRGSPLGGARALTESGKVFRGAISLDGRYVAYVKRDRGKDGLRLLQVATDRDVLLLEGSPLRIWSLHFSPDGNFVYFLRQITKDDPEKDGVYRIATLGGPTTPLATDATNNSVTVSPDGKLIAYISNSATESSIVDVDPNGSGRKVIAKRPLGFQFWFIEWSHSMNTIAAVAIGNDDMGLVLVDAASGNIKELTMTGWGWGAIGQPAWSPDDSEVYAPAREAGGAMFQIWRFDPHTGAHQALTSNSTDYWLWSLSATGNGSLLADTITPDLSLWTTNKDGQWRAIPSARGEGLDGVAWVDNRIVSSSVIDMFVHDDDASSPRKLRSYWQGYKQLAPCGPTRVAYWAVDKTRGNHVNFTDISTGESAALTAGPYESNPACSPDGNTLIYRHEERSMNKAHLMWRSLSSGQSGELFKESNIDSPKIAPDGKTVLFRVTHASGVPPEWVMIPITGGPVKKINLPESMDTVWTLKWASDGKSVLYPKNENGVENLWSFRLDGGKPTKLTDFPSDTIFSYDVSHDNRFVVSRGQVLHDLVLLEDAK